jgi:hypothetical protein
MSLSLPHVPVLVHVPVRVLVHVLVRVPVCVHAHVRFPVRTLSLSLSMS